MHFIEDEHEHCDICKEPVVWDVIEHDTIVRKKAQCHRCGYRMFRVKTDVSEKGNSLIEVDIGDLFG